MGRPTCQDNWRAEEELTVPEFLMPMAKRRVNNLNSYENRNSYVNLLCSKMLNTRKTIFMDHIILHAFE